MKNFKSGDVILIILIVVSLLLISYFLFGSQGDEATLVITTPTEEYIYPLDEDGVYAVQGYLGESVIEVKDCEVCFTASACKNKLCMVGTINHNGQFLACLPNGVIVSVVSSEREEVDDVSI